MINDKYYNTINYVYENKEKFDWKLVNRDWVRDLELPDYESGDLRDCYYFVSDKNALGFAVGSYYSRFYHDSDEYSKSKEYFITFFIAEEKQSIKGVNLVTADEYLNFKRKKYSILWGIVEEEDYLKALYDYAKNSSYNMDSLLLDFLDEDEKA